MKRKRYTAYTHKGNTKQGKTVRRYVRPNAERFSTATVSLAKILQ